MEYGKEALCKRSQCDGHHDEDFAPNYWILRKVDRVAEWRMGDFGEEGHPDAEMEVDEDDIFEVSDEDGSDTDLVGDGEE